MSKRKAAIPRPEYGIDDVIMMDRSQQADFNRNEGKKIATISSIQILLSKKAPEVRYFFSDADDYAVETSILGKCNLEMKRKRRSPAKKEAPTADAVIADVEAQSSASIQ